MMFNICNHIYAATRRRGGFGVFYQSRDLENMTEANKSLINKNGSYQETNVLQENPPVNYAYYVIDDRGKKRAALLRSIYTGATNHTPDRMGNYLTHTVVFDNPLENYCLPELFKAIPFRESLTIEEEDTFTPPQETLDFVQYRVNQALKEALQFLCQDMKRLSVLLQAVDDIVNGWLEADGHSIILVAPTNDECCKLLFALYTIIPPAVINKYSFATYINDPRNVRYQLCGAVPGCLISGISAEYFKICDMSKQAGVYVPRHNFTTILKKWIVNKDVDKIVGLGPLFSQNDVKKLDKQVEIPFEIEVFKDNVSSMNISQFDRILGLFSPSQNQIKMNLVDFVRRNNPNLYLEYLTNETKRLVCQGNMLFETIEDSLGKVPEEVTGRTVLNFYNEIESNMPRIYDKATIAANLLLSDTASTKRLMHNSIDLKNYLFQRVDSEWGKVSCKEDFINQYRQELRYGCYPNIQCWMQKKQIYDDIRQGLFFVNFDSYQQLWETLRENEKINFIKGAIDQKNSNGKMTEELLLNVIGFVVRCFTNPAVFWNDYFKMSNNGSKEENEPKYSDMWPISLIKRHVLFYEIAAGRINNYQDTIADLSEYETLWLSDELISHHQKKNHKAFLELLPPKTQKQGFWPFSRRKRGQ